MFSYDDAYKFYGYISNRALLHYYYALYYGTSFFLATPFFSTFLISWKATKATMNKQMNN